MPKKKQPLTTNAGAPVVENQNTMSAGPRGAADAAKALKIAWKAPK